MNGLNLVGSISFNLVDVELSHEKWIGVILLLGGRSWEDHISGPPGGSNNFSYISVESVQNFKEQSPLPTQTQNRCGVL